MRLTAKTDKGITRKTNQDTFYFQSLDKNACFAIVCDGMGGRKAGHIASQMTREIIKKRINSEFTMELDFNGIKSLIFSAINQANYEVFEKSKSSLDFDGMGTTLTFVLVKEFVAFIAHIGDSRIYSINKNEINQITTDHSMVQMLYDKGEITFEEMKNHPQKNIITRAIGVEKNIEIDYKEVPFEFGMNLDSKILLCSDGLHNVVGDEEILEIVNSISLENVCDTLIDLANNNGGPDNITVAIVAE